MRPVEDEFKQICRREMIVKKKKKPVFASFNSKLTDSKCKTSHRFIFTRVRFAKRSLFHLHVFGRGN